MEILLRGAGLEDCGALVLLNRECMGYDYPEEETRKKLCGLLADIGNKILVAEVAGKVAGYIHLADYDTLYAPPMKNIMGIAVSPQYRRRGVGRLLLEAGERWAVETGAAGVRLVSGETRTGAHAFYRSLGYRGCKMQLNLKKMFAEN